MRMRHRQRGAVAVELALVMIPLLLIAFGITEFGRAMYQYNTLAKSARDAARYLTQKGPGEGSGTAKCLAVYGNRTCSGSPLAPGLTTDHIRVHDQISSPTTHQNQATGSGVINLVSVTVAGYQFVSLVPFVAPNMTFGDISVTMRQVL
ncbi:TadE/TadG family type IV pilus assembly protein [Aromatoleum buckelii]|uniref:Pilus assembly protein n=1 Tax=Aromatoleum buckelii TaxID=200254 RepID=A0ABX1MV83_9RHOO|nr:TadE family protein [Aromatoleum buckelii]MCK0510439.1 pilus assembly protein [Aromatoleum buckelii]